MKKQTSVSARVDEDLKIKAEEVLSELGISLSASITMFLRQVVVHNGLPFDVTLNKPVENTAAEQSQAKKVSIEQAVELEIEPETKIVAPKAEEDELLDATPIEF